MSEQIGKVVLDDTFYPGEDLYCDGEVEDTLLSIVKEYPESEFQRIIEENGSWPVLYHLSHFRENIVNWLPLDKSMKVLEVGSGCGAVTGALCARAGSVTSVDLSKKRSRINAYRHKNCDNLTIKMGNFKDIEPTLDTDYDYIFLIGVFEYGQGYMGSDTPYADFMNILKKHRAPKGRIVIAIENKYGLKYFAGCKEDHLGTYFTGIEDYPADGGVRTFSRNGLIRIMEACGIGEYHFYYPYPDYKFMTTIYSDEYLPRVGELTNNLRNFDRERMLLFDEKNAFDGLIRDGMFPEFSNSFLIVIGSRPEQLYAKFSNDRKAEYAIRTTICEGGSASADETAEGKGPEERVRYVEKTPDLPQAASHVACLKRQYELLTGKYDGSGLRVNRCEENGAGVRFEYLHGDTLEAALDECLYGNDVEGFQKLLNRYRETVDYRQEMPVCDYDLIFPNIMIDDTTKAWTLIDYEWTFGQALSGEDMARRAMFVYLLGPDIRRRWLFEHGIAQSFGVTPQNLQALQEEELKFQQEVTGGRASMYELYHRMGQPILPVYEMLETRQQEDTGRRFQIYEDTGEGFSEGKSCFVPDVYGTDGRICLSYTFGNDVKRLRLDPAMEPCMLYDMELSVNGVLTKVLQETNGARSGNGALVFATQDPNMTVNLEKTALSGSNRLVFTASIEWLSMEAAACLQEVKEGRKGFFKNVTAYKNRNTEH